MSRNPQSTGDGEGDAKTAIHGSFIARLGQTMTAREVSMREIFVAVDGVE